MVRVARVKRPKKRVQSRKQFKVCAVFDTETTTIQDDWKSYAFPILFVWNNLAAVDLETYSPGDDQVHYYRDGGEILAEVDFLIDLGQSKNFIPVVAGYNIIFDLQPLLFEMSETWKMKVLAQTENQVYALDIVEQDEILCRFWDTFFLESNGLAAMGEICGFKKLYGDWDYDLIRTPETELTADELEYAKRDVQIIPAYLNYLLKTHDWLKPHYLGGKVMTKTSLVRQFAKHRIGRAKYKTAKGTERTIYDAFKRTCAEEFPKTFESYAMRKACFRGGLTFTAGKFANTAQKNVLALDVSSMHHTFINGRYVPVHFKPTNKTVLEELARQVLETSLKDVLKFYHQPFMHAFHAQIKFTNLRLKPDTVFERFGIGIISSAKFSKRVRLDDYGHNQAGMEAEKATRGIGYHDVATKAVFAFGKLMQAREATLFLNEVELWNLGQVYEWDNFEILQGESTLKYAMPPDYVTLQSNVLFEQKAEIKALLQNYRAGVPYEGELSKWVPTGIRKEIKDGTCKRDFLEAYYVGTVKTMFNSIFGSQAMDLLRPDFEIVQGEIGINFDTVVTPENFEKRRPEKITSFYNYGSRIVAGSRMHLIIALILLGKKSKSILILSGDTDSVKVSIQGGRLTDKGILKALDPLAKASRKALDMGNARIRKLFPENASSLDGVGCFEIEPASRESTRYKFMFEAWNKARISLTDAGEIGVIVAGLSRPAGAYHIEKAIKDFHRAGYDFEAICQNVLGYDVFISPEITQSLQRNIPDVTARVEEEFIDHRGVKSKVSSYQSIALFPCGKWLGELEKKSNRDNVIYLSNLGREVDTREKIISIQGNYVIIEVMDEWGESQEIMKAVIHRE